jgi:hypothetical protein
MTGAKKLTLYLAAMVIVLPVLIIGRCEYRSQSFARGFNAINVGDSRQTVVELMSKQDPGEVVKCLPEDRCKYTYLYYTFMQRWMVDFDENDRVVSKVHHEGLY